jgi:hypothetical protein
VGANIKRRQHTVAQLLLQGFADERGHVIESQRGGKEHRTNVKNASVIANFYTTTLEDGNPSTVVEDWLADRIEGPAVGPIAAARHGHPIEPHHVEALAKFVISSLLRTRLVQGQLLQIGDTVGPLLLLQRAMAASNESHRLKDPVERERLLRIAEAAYERIRPTVNNPNAQLRVILRKIDELTPRLVEWRWDVHAGRHASLVLGDAPVSALGRHDREGWDGIVPDGAALVLPVSPTAVIVGTATPTDRFTRLVGVLPLTSDLVEAVNGLTISGASRSVFRHPKMRFPRDFELGPNSPLLPDPTVTWTDSDDESADPPPPPLQDPLIREMMRQITAGSHAHTSDG